MPTDIYDELMTVFGRRMACVVVSVKQLTGEHAGRQNTQFYPGFFISISDQWLFVTAGHSICELDNALQAGAVQMVTAKFIDCFSPKAPHQDSHTASFPFDYESTQRSGFYFDFDRGDDELDGRDFGFLKVRPLFRKLLEANGICPLDEGLWTPPTGTKLNEHILVGVPNVLIESYVQHEKTTFLPENVCILLRRPTSPVTDRAQHRRLAFQLPDEMPFEKIEGMSGGPIFAIGDGPAGRGCIWVVAIQSKQKGRIVFGYPFSEVVKYLQQAIAELPE